MCQKKLWSTRSLDKTTFRIVHEPFCQLFDLRSTRAPVLHYYSWFIVISPTWERIISPPVRKRHLWRWWYILFPVWVGHVIIPERGCLFFLRSEDPCNGIFTYIYRENQLNVGKYSNPMECRSQDHVNQILPQRQETCCKRPASLRTYLTQHEIRESWEEAKGQGQICWNHVT